MEVHVFLLILLVILLTARVFAEIATRLNAPPVIGELVAGVILGPSLLGWVEPFEVIRFLAEIGIILLLFKVGVETDLQRLAHAGWKALVVAIGGLALPFALGFAAAHLVFDLPMLVALFVGGTLTATSIGITVRILSDLGIQRGYEGQIVLGAAVLDDILGVVLLALLYEFAAAGGVSLGNAGKVTLFVAVFFILAPVAAKVVSVVIKYFDDATEIPGLIPTMMVSLVLFFAWLARELGAPELLGGFAAGLALSRRFFLPLGVALRADPAFTGRIEEEMNPIVHLFTPIFFVTVGLSLNLRAIDWTEPHIWQFSIVLFIVAVAGKFAGAMAIRESLPTRIMIGISMVPRGEVGLVFAELGRESGVFSNEIYAAMIIVIALTTFLPPLVLKWFYGKHGEKLVSHHTNIEPEAPLRN